MSFFNPFRRSSVSRTSAHSLSESEETEHLEATTAALNLFLNEEIALAEHELEKSDSAFHVLARGLVVFLRGTLGYEPEVLKDAYLKLSAAESIVYERHRRSQEDPNAFTSSIYPKGTEYALLLAQCQLMLAVVGILNASLTESVKGLYKMRKAYLTIESIAACEQKYLRDHGYPEDIDDLSTHKSAAVKDPVDTEHGQETDLKLEKPENKASETPFKHPIDVFIHSSTTAQYGLLLVLISVIPQSVGWIVSIIGFRGDRKKGLALIWRATKYNNIAGAQSGLMLSEYYNGVIRDLDILPPSVYPQKRLQDLVVQMRTWYPNSVLWGVSGAQILASDKRLEEAAIKLGKGPGVLGESVEARADQADDKTAVATENDTGASTEKDEKTTLKQVEALRHFARSLCTMHLHAYQISSDSFMRCVSSNNWSHGLYYYIAASAHAELYRVYKYGGILPDFSSWTDSSVASSATSLQVIEPDETLAAHHSEQAEDLYGKVQAHTGKRRLMARQLPFDVFVNRKLTKWKLRAQEWNVSLVDAIGVSPFEEMIFLWGGHGRMRKEHLELSLNKLALCDGNFEFATPPPGAATTPVADLEKTGIDEKASLALLRGSILSHLDRTTEARAVLRSEIIDTHSWQEYKAIKHGDIWASPVARYEMATCCWRERFLSKEDSLAQGDVLKDEDGAALDREKLMECSKWLEEVFKWGDGYDIDVRFNLKVKTGRDTLEKLGIRPA